MQARTLALAVMAGAAGASVLARVWRTSRAMDFAGRRVAIIGGSRGLGLVIARELAAEGARLVLAARDVGELERARDDLESRGAEVGIVTCDVRDRVQAQETVDRIAQQLGGLDVLINDAGVIQVGPVEHMTLADFEDAMGTHFWGPLYTMLAALPHMRRAGGGRIVNISSIGGKIALPHLVPYSASKFALTGLSEGMQAELAKDGIRVTTVCPGLMRTGSTYNAWFKGRHRREFAWFHLSVSLPGLSIDARRAARQIIEACRRGDAELIITLPARLAVLANALSPNVVARAISLANRLLPAPAPDVGSESRIGWQSVSRAAPSFITRLADRATLRNNEVPV